MSPSIKCIAILSLVVILGCSRGPTMGQVTGTVNYRGKPLPHGTILFEVSGHLLSRGEIKDGKIVNVTTTKQGDGVPVGHALVSINSIAEATIAPTRKSETGGTEGGMLQGQDLIPVRYSTPTTSGLTATIEPGMNELDFDLTH